MHSLFMFDGLQNKQHQFLLNSVKVITDMASIAQV